jgi:hypothetical protein
MSPSRSSTIAVSLALGAALLTATACRSVTTQQPINIDSAVATHGEPARAWEVLEDGRVVGSLVKYEDAAEPARGFFSVRNVDRQALGIIDLDGRAWRYRPHVKDAEWLGTGTVAQSASRILGCSDACELREIPLSELDREPTQH